MRQIFFSSYSIVSNLLEVMVLQPPPLLEGKAKALLEEISVDLDDVALDALEDEPLVERGSLPALKAKQVPEYVINSLSNLLTPQNRTGLARWFYHPLLLIAIGLHLGLFFVPNGKQADQKTPENKEKPVTITKVSTGKLEQKPTPKVPVKVRPKLPRVKRLPTTAPVIKPFPQPTPIAQAVAPSALPQGTPKSQPSPGDAIDPNNPFADFPHLGRKNADGEYVVAGKPLATVVAHFNQALPPRGYTANPTVAETNRHVIEFEKGGKIAFLNIFQDDADVVYVIAETPIESLAILRGATQVPSELVSLFAELPMPVGVSDGAESGTPVPSDFENPGLFFKNVKNGDFQDNIGGISPRVISYNAELLYEEQLEPTLKQIFTITPVGSYGGGNLWKLQQGKTEFFLNLVPSQSRNGVSVILWTSKPT